MRTQNYIENRSMSTNSLLLVLVSCRVNSLRDYFSVLLRAQHYSMLTTAVKHVFVQVHLCTIKWGENGNDKALALPNLKTPVPVKEIF